MKKQTIISLIMMVFLMSNFGFGQSEEHPFETELFQLNWKIDESDTISYETIMTEIGESKFEMNFGSLFGKLTDSIDVEEDFDKDFVNKLKGLYANTNIITRLTNSEDFSEVIDIEMIAIPKEKSKEDDNENETNKTMSSMMEGTILRGSVYKTGELNSFWVKRAQKNLLSIFFELPRQPIKRGDTWTLNNINLIGNDHNFICREAEKKNVISIVDIKQVNGENIAVINYDVLEYASGDFSTPAFFGNEGSLKKTTVICVFKAQAEFSIEKGKWISYNGMMSLDASGAFNSNQRQKIALSEK